MAVGELFMVQTQQGAAWSRAVVNMDGLDGLNPKSSVAPYIVPPLTPPPAIHTKTIVIVIAAVFAFVAVLHLDGGCAAELPTPQNQRIIEQTALLRSVSKAPMA
jgi:hypothetical protein